jgi:hypothetical protein
MKLILGIVEHQSGLEYYSQERKRGRRIVKERRREREREREEQGIVKINMTHIKGN